MSNIVISTYIMFYSMIYGVDERLIHAVVKTETGYDQSVIGEFQEIGMAQIRPKYIDPILANLLHEEEFNLAECSRILSKLESRYNKRLGVYWINAYNAGPTGALKIHKAKKSQTFAYYKKITNNYEDSFGLNDLYINKRVSDPSYKNLVIIAWAKQ